MQMAQAAGVRGVGVSYGYHDRAQLTEAHSIIDSMGDLAFALDEIWSVPA